MTETVQHLLNSFDALSESERHEAAVQLLRRVLRDAPATVSDETLVSAADELFVELDAREAENGHS
jgi:hypothetical protein